MAYNGYLIKVGNYSIPLKYIKAETYNVTKNSQDLDSFRDLDGVLHRTALSHNPIKVEFETPPLITNTEVNTLLTAIKGQYTVAEEKKVKASVYVPETDSYIVQDMYMPDIQFQIYGIFNNVIKYNPIRIAFIGY